MTDEPARRALVHLPLRADVELYEMHAHGALCGTGGLVPSQVSPRVAEVTCVLCRARHAQRIQSP